MRNSSRTMVFKRATLIIKDKNMRKFIIAIVMTMFGFAANVNAEIVATVQNYENVSHYVTKSIPDATEEEIQKCYDAVKNGGSYSIKRDKVRIECAEEEMVVFRRLFF